MCVSIKSAQSKHITINAFQTRLYIFISYSIIVLFKIKSQLKNPSQNKNHLQTYFNELYFIPEHPSLKSVSQILRKYTDMKYLTEQSGQKSTGPITNNDNYHIKAVICLIKNYLKI